ncbi:MAG: MFS transporter [Alphaproteobacteria bacterium]|jgi:predicted MFS family arabinose efflux permease|nr:MFS transporter [Alphaproteobacteria bacterium]
MHDILKASILAPLLSILAIQSVINTASYGLSVIAPEAAPAIGIAPESVGFLVSTVYFTAMVTGLASGVLVTRLGATRAFQGMLLLVAGGIAALAASTPVTAYLGAMLIGLGTGPMNPAGSYVLARVSPPTWQPFIFSVKQCGTPAGGMLAGVVLPPLMLAYDWRLAIAVIPAVAAILFLAAPAGRLGRREAPPEGRRGDIVRGTLEALRVVLRDKLLRGFAVIGMVYAGVQVGFASYLVVYVWRKVGMSPAEAGLLFAVLHTGGIVARIVLGYLAGRYFTSQGMLVALGIVMSASYALAATFSAAWPVALVYVVIVVTGMSGNGWVGLYYAEIARLAPDGRTAEVAGGCQFFMYSGIVSGPLLFGAVLNWTGSYVLCIGGLAAATLMATLYLQAIRKEAAG